MIATVAVILCLAAIAVLAVVSWLLNEENKSLIAENDAIGGQWNRAVQRKDEQIAELKNELLNVSREWDEMQAIGVKLYSSERLRAEAVSENKRLSDNLTAWVEKYDRLQSKASELCEVLRADS